MTTPPRPLAHLQVVDCTTGIAGPYCTKLFADAGADVIKVEPASGDPLRRFAFTAPVPPGEDGALFRFLNAGKRSVIASIEDERVDAMLAGADLLIEDLAPAALDVPALRARHPHLVIVSITAFGRSGPMAGAPASDLTLQTESGAIGFKGPTGRAPVQAGGRVSEMFGGLFAAPPALAAVLHAQATGEGEHVDVSIHDVLAVAGSNYSSVLHDAQGAPQLDAPMRYIDTPGIEQAADGLVGVNTNAAYMFQMFLLMIERPDLMDDPHLAGIRNRLAMGDAWQSMVDAWFARHTVAEALDAAAGLRVPVAPVHDAASVLSDAHLCEREVFVTGLDGLVRPRPPYLVDGHVLDATRPAPTIGEHDGTVHPRPARTTHTAPTSAPGARTLPLAGCKVVDLTSWWVGALATQTLAFLGADVIHVEGVGHPDGMRLTGSTLARSEDWWEWGHMFAAANAGKRAIALDISTTEGRALLERLIGWADVLVENFAPRVAESWGLTHDAVLADHPALVYQRMPAYGLTGPWRDRPAFAQTIEPMSGMATITGYPDDRPLAKGGIPDPTAGMHGAWALLVAIAHRRRTGHGVAVEATMVEAALNMCAAPLVEHSAYGTVMGRAGNRAPHAAPQGVYPTAGDDAWLAISVLDDDAWRALVDVVADERLEDARFRTAADRHRRHDEIDVVLGAWTAGRAAATAAALLRSRGVAVSAFGDPRLIAEQPQYRERRLFEPVDHRVLGTLGIPGLPCRFASVDRWIHAPAPTFGQDNRVVLAEVLGLDPAEIDALAMAGVIAERPRGL